LIGILGVFLALVATTGRYGGSQHCGGNPLKFHRSAPFTFGQFKDHTSSLPY
jgi:hypothetical protein